MPDKFKNSGYHATKSSKVNAPIIDEFLICMECELAEIVETENMFAVVGKIVNVNVDAERFINIAIKNPFDYTEWRKTNVHENISVRELSKKAMVVENAK